MTLFDVKIPQQGLTVDSVTIMNWLKNVGDTVDSGEPLYEILSDKANLEVESPVAGTIVQILKLADQEAAIGEVVAILKTGD